ncbi:CRAL-TRIO domain and CRAL/TRIO, N-terminal domain-containing protein [Aphelenchoides besseyi]|nr:CRAL-TRIO domain and CRAL/TRIO, N-terminal domain-containing protein [Aphelenchoides besseyi]
MMSCESVQPVFNDRENEWLNEVEKRTGITIQPNSSTDYSVGFNILRWCYAYNGDLDDATGKYKRHLRIREILELDRIDQMGESDGIDELAERYAPTTMLGYTGINESKCPVFLEESGHFDLQGMMTKIRAQSFMLNRFRQMERILAQIRNVERETGRMSGAILIIDLEGLSFQANLIRFLSGTYRIFWGTLMEQYAFLFRKFIIVNAPTFMNLLWTACAGFIPKEYKEKVHLIQNNNGCAELHEHVDPRILLLKYGGQSKLEPNRPSACYVPSIFSPIGTELESITVPAGKSLIQSFHLTEGDRSISDPSSELLKMQESIFAGCERPGLPTIDSWTAKVPSTGYYHVIMGNEKAWIISVRLEFGLFNVAEKETKIDYTNQTVV